MNYIDELNNFRKFTEFKKIPGATQSLWFLLIHINNKYGWKEWFNISNSILAKELCMTEKTIIKHREILISNELIFYKSQMRKKKSGEYNMVSLSKKIMIENKENGNETGVKITADSIEQNETGVKITADLIKQDETGVKITADLIEQNETGVKITADLIKQDETGVKITADLIKQDETGVKITADLIKQDETAVKITAIPKLIHSISNTTTMKIDFDFIINFYNQNFYLVGSYEKIQLEKWSKVFDYEMILFALEEALKNNVKKYKYVEGIFNNWSSSKLENLDDVKKHMKKFSSKNVTEINSKNKFHNFKSNKNKYTNEELEKKLGLRK